MDTTNYSVPSRFASYITDWDYETYLLVGGYGSSKSKSTAIKIILKLLQEKRTALVVRDVFDTLRDSCFSLIKEVLEELGILSDSVNGRKHLRDEKVMCVSSPMEVRFPNGSKIIFRGLDKVEKVKSINNVSIVWVEECSEIKYDAYMELIGRIRNPKLSLHFILTCNPIGRENWVYKEFFKRTDNKGKEIIVQDEQEFYRRRTLINRSNGVYYMHSVPNDNPFLQKSYIRRLDSLKQRDPKLWLTARWGRFGTTGSRVLPRFKIAKNAKEFKRIVTSIPAHMHFFGLDFGFEESFNALIACCVDDNTETLYIYDEVYRNHITDDLFAKLPEVLRIKDRAEKCMKPISADSAEPKAIQYYRQQCYDMYGCYKYAGSRLQNTKKMRMFKNVVCSPRCKNTILELKDLTFAKDSKGNTIYDEFNIDSHVMSALWYALDNYTFEDLKNYKTNSKAG